MSCCIVLGVVGGPGLIRYVEEPRNSRNPLEVYSSERLVEWVYLRMVDVCIMNVGECNMRRLNVRSVGPRRRRGVKNEWLKIDGKNLLSLPPPSRWYRKWVLGYAGDEGWKMSDLWNWSRKMFRPYPPSWCIISTQQNLGARHWPLKHENRPLLLDGLDPPLLLDGMIIERIHARIHASSNFSNVNIDLKFIFHSTGITSCSVKMFD